MFLFNYFVFSIPLYFMFYDFSTLCKIHNSEDLSIKFCFTASVKSIYRISIGAGKIPPFGIKKMYNTFDITHFLIFPPTKSISLKKERTHVHLSAMHTGIRSRHL